MCEPNFKKFPLGIPEIHSVESDRKPQSGREASKVEVSNLDDPYIWNKLFHLILVGIMIDLIWVLMIKAVSNDLQSKC